MFYLDFDKLKDQNEKFYSGERMRFRHYYRLNSKLVGQGFETELVHVLELCSADVEDYKRRSKYDYDFALSFAGEDRLHAEKLAQCLRRRRVRVFYDEYEQADLLGKDLYTHLYEIYSIKARFCVIFISSSYVTKMWTVHERKSAQERALREREGEYILPIKLDNAVLPGLPGTIAHVSISQGIPSICKMLKTKLDKQTQR